jgi:hypothetical protein
MNKTFWTILKDFPPASVNNSREIIRHYLELFKKYRNPYYAKQLEDFGIDVDYSPLDNGN